MLLCWTPFDDDEPGGKRRRTKTKAARRNGKRKNVFFFFCCRSMPLLLPSPRAGLRDDFLLFIFLLVGDTYLSAEFQSAAAAVAWCSILVSNEHSTQNRASRCVFGNKTFPTSALFLFCVFRPNNKKKLFSSLSRPSSLLSSSSLYDDYYPSFSLKILLLSFVVLEDPKLSTTLLVFPLGFVAFVFTRLRRDDGIVVVVAVLAVFSDCFLLFVFRVIISSCLFVRSFVFVLVSRGRGGVLEGLGKNRHQKKKV